MHACTCTPHTMHMNVPCIISMQRVVGASWHSLLAPWGESCQGLCRMAYT